MGRGLLRSVKFKTDAKLQREEEEHVEVTREGGRREGRDSEVESGKEIEREGEGGRESER